ncbi:MAG: NADH-quinone oxidoreductase subunit M [Verrucomicrobiota bacterium]|jgi:NADH-quinone oxidoreductase subunit M
MLAWTIYISFLGAAAQVLLPPESRCAARLMALLTALAALAAALLGAAQYERLAPSGAVADLVNISWIADLGIRFHLAADGVSVTLVLLTGIASVAGVLFSWNIERRAREFFALYLALIGGVYGVFLSFDLFLLFVFYEIAIIPKYFLIAVWGSTRREYGAMKLALYSLAGSAMVLIGLIAAYVVSGSHTFELLELAKYPFPAYFQIWAFLLVFVGFAVLAGLWPFHTWAPTGHVAAPTAASMLLAGVVMKLGAYGALRVAMTLFPVGLHFWQNGIAVLAVIGIVYGATVALVQRDLKFVIGYSSVSHMGFVLLGLMTLTQIGLSGAVLQMFSHGIVAGLLFAVVGRMIYDRTHTRQLSELQPMNLSVLAPFVSVVFVLAGVASIGLPGFSGFVAELQVLVGSWSVFPRLTIFAGIGILLGFAYMVRVWMKALFAENEPKSAAINKLKPVSIPERAGAFLLLGTAILIGLWPNLLLTLINPALHSPQFQPLWKGALP